MALVKHGAGTLKDEVKVDVNKKSGVVKVASKPLPKAPAPAPVQAPAPAPAKPREKADGEPVR